MWTPFSAFGLKGLGHFDYYVWGCIWLHLEPAQLLRECTQVTNQAVVCLILLVLVVKNRLHLV